MIDLGLQNLWVQFGIINEPAAIKAQEAGIAVVMDRCILIEHARLFGELRARRLNCQSIVTKPCPQQPSSSGFCCLSFYNERMSSGRTAQLHWNRLRCTLFACLLALLPLSCLHAQIAEVGDGGPGPVKAQHLTAGSSTSRSLTRSPRRQPRPSAPRPHHRGATGTSTGWMPATPGEPPSIKWTLPKGFTAGPLQFPPPQRLPLGPLMDYGYEDQVAFPITLTAPADAKPGKIHLDAHVSWLVCAQVCLPGKAHLGLDMNVVHGPLEPAPVVGALGEALNLIPKPLPSTMSATAIGDAKHIQLTLKTGSHEEDAEFYPYLENVCDAKGACAPESVIANAADQEIQSLPDGVRVTLQRASDSTSLPKSLQGVVELSSTESYELTAPVTPGVVTSGLTPAAKAAKRVTPASVTIFGAIGLAFLGGLILNLMPCVFTTCSSSSSRASLLLNSSGEKKKEPAPPRPRPTRSASSSPSGSSSPYCSSCAPAARRLG